MGLTTLILPAAGAPHVPNGPDKNAGAEHCLPPPQRLLALPATSKGSVFLRVRRPNRQSSARQLQTRSTSIGLGTPSAADPIPPVHDPATSRQPQVDSGDSMCAYPRTCPGRPEDQDTAHDVHPGTSLADSPVAGREGVALYTTVALHTPKAQADGPRTCSSNGTTRVPTQWRS